MAGLFQWGERVRSTHERALYIGLSVLVSLWFALGTSALITDAPLRYDAAQNINIAYRFIHTGEFTFGGKAKKAMKREPVPVLVAAAWLLLHPSFENYKNADLKTGRLTSTVKLANVFWEFVAALFIFLLCLELFQKPLVAGIGGVFALAISDMTFLSTSQVIDTLLNELPAAALMLVASWCAVRFVRDPTIGRALSLGIALGILSLTKAAFFSIGLGFILLLALVEWRKLIYGTDSQSHRQVRKLYAVLVLAMLATITPWIARNAINYGRFEMIAGRGEGILGVRMMLAELPSLGVLYASSPPPLKDRLGPVLGYSQSDLEPDGRLAIFNTHPEAQWYAFDSQRKAEGYAGTNEQWLRRKAFWSAVERPFEYLISVGLFAYRGMWFMQPSGLAGRLNPMVFCALSAFSLLCLLGVFFGGLIAGNRVLVAVFGLAVGAFFFYSALSYGLPRYIAPNTPFAAIAVFWVLNYFIRAGRRVAATSTVQ